MGKSDKEQTKKRAHKAIGNSKHKAADGDIVRTRNSQLWTLLEVVPLKQLMRPLMMEELVTLDGANSSENCVNTRYTSATVSCRSGTLSTPSSDGGFRLSALDTGRTRKKNQLR